MECPFCRRDNRADARFCDACGTRLAAPAGVQQAETSAVSRESELAALADLLGRMASGHGAIAMLAGEPGIGKSHTAQITIHSALIRSPCASAMVPNANAPSSATSVQTTKLDVRLMRCLRYVFSFVSGIGTGPLRAVHSIVAMAAHA